MGRAGDLISVVPVRAGRLDAARQPVARGVELTTRGAGPPPMVTCASLTCRIDQSRSPTAADGHLCIPDVSNRPLAEPDRRRWSLVRKKQIELNASISRVWRALTDHREFGEWFRVDLESAFVPGRGGSAYRTRLAPRSSRR